MKDNAAANKNYGISLLRILATILVIFGHTCSTIYQNPDLFPLTTAQKHFFVCTIFRWTLPTFLMITGALLLKPGKKICYRDCLGKYCKRMILALIIFGVPFAGLMQYAKGGRGFDLVWKSFAAILTGESFSHLWYLYLLIGIYLIMPILRAFTEKAGEKENLYAVIILFVFTICVPTLNRICGWHIVFSVPLGYSVFYVLSGYYLMYCVKVRNKWPLICGIVLITGILIVFSCLEIFPEEWEQNDNLLVAAEAVLFFCVFKEITLHRDNSLIWKADRLCFAVYLIHPLFIQFCYRFLGITPLSAGKWYAPAALGFGLFFTACSFLGSILLHRIKALHDYVL